MTVFDEQPDLLRRFRAGDRAALEVVYRACFDDVYRLLRFGFLVNGVRVPPLHDESAALEAVHDAFVRAFGPTARLAYDGLRPYRPYVLRIARNSRIDQLRRQNRQPGLLADAPDDVPEPCPPEASPEERAHAQRLEEATAQYVAGLDPESRRFVALRFEQDGSQRDVAAQMGLTRRRVRTLEDRVQSGLRAFLERRGLR